MIASAHESPWHIQDPSLPRSCHLEIPVKRTERGRKVSYIRIETLVKVAPSSGGTEVEDNVFLKPALKSSSVEPSSRILYM